MTMEHALSSGPAPSRLKVWIEACRPFFVHRFRDAVVVGSVLGALDGPLFLGTFFYRAVRRALHSYRDQYGQRLLRPSERRGYAGLPERQSGSARQLLSPNELYWGGIIAFGIGSVLGLVLVGLCGWPILALGVASVLAGYFYTARPLSLAYIALGEATVFVFMGTVIIIGAYYVQREAFPLAPVLISLPVGCLVAAILQGNNIRDMRPTPPRQKYAGDAGGATGGQLGNSRL